MSYPLTRRGAIAGLIAAGTLSHVRAGRAQSGPIRIACLQTLTGPPAEVGREVLLGTQVAVKQINAGGGVDGRQIELLVRDSKYSPTETVAAVQEYIGAGVNLFVGEVYTPMNLAILPLLKAQSIIWISPNVTLMSLTHELYDRHFFRAGVNSYMRYNSEALLMAQQYPAVLRWGGVISNIESGHGNWNAMTSNMKRHYKDLTGHDVQIADPVLTNINATDYRNAAAALATQDIEGLIIGTTGGDSLNFIKQAKAYGLLDKMKAIPEMSLGLQAGTALKTGVPAHFWSPATWVIDGYKHVPMARKFYDDASAESKNPAVSAYAAQGHTTMMAFAESIRAAKSTATDPVIAALETTEFSTVYGPLRFRKEDHQMLISESFVELAPQEAEPGWKLVKYVKMPANDILEPASPGVKF